jgi:hypothetical protein
VGVVGDLVRARHDLVVYCEGCWKGGGRMFRYEELAERFGEGTALEDLRSRLTCKLCGARKASVRLSVRDAEAVARPRDS